MIRVIKRYESRKLYDTEESRYVSLEDIAQWVRDGQEIQVIDNATSDEVTAQILTQVILDEGKKGTSFLPTELLHELVRSGERAFHSGVEQVQTGVDRLVQKSIDRLPPVRQAREEMAVLRRHLSDLEATLAGLEESDSASGASQRKSTAKQPAGSATAAAEATTATTTAGKSTKPAAKRKSAPSAEGSKGAPSSKGSKGSKGNKGTKGTKGSKGTPSSKGNKRTTRTESAVAAAAKTAGRTTSNSTTSA